MSFVHVSDGIIQKMSLVLIIVKLLCKVNRLDNVACWKMRKPFGYLSEYSRQVFFFNLNNHSSATYPLV